MPHEEPLGPYLNGILEKLMEIERELLTGPHTLDDAIFQCNTLNGMIEKAKNFSGITKGQKNRFMFLAEEIRVHVGKEVLGIDISRFKTLPEKKYKVTIYYQSREPADEFFLDYNIDFASGMVILRLSKTEMKYISLSRVNEIIIIKQEDQS